MKANHQRIALVVAALAGTSLLALASDGRGQRRAALPFPEVGSPGGPSHALSPAEQEMWRRGRARFDRPFHKEEGLGNPELNADSCRACHQDPALGGAGGLELNVSRHANDNGGVGPFTNPPGGQGLSKLRGPWMDGREEYTTTSDVFEQRQTPSVLGDGLIETILDSEILANEDPTDADVDGIFGVARLIATPSGTEIGRFGWKGQVPTLEDFVRDAMGGECGITTSDDGRGFAFLSDADGIADPELSDAELDNVTFFLANLAAPQRKGSTDPDVAVGETLFGTIGCAKCHVPTLNGTGGPVDLYSNLLLHNVMPVGYRGMEETGAGVGFFQTPPLWGISDTAPYMHDGRAETLEDAILAHHGEATTVRMSYELLSAADKSALVTFLEDL